MADWVVDQGAGFLGGEASRSGSSSDSKSGVRSRVRGGGASALRGAITSAGAKNQPGAPLEGGQKTAIDTARARLFVFLVLSLLGFLLLMVRALGLGFAAGSSGAVAAPGYVASVEEILAEATAVSVSRADIVDRHGVVLAKTLWSDALFVRPEQVRYPERIAASLSHILGRSVGHWQAKLKGSGFRYLAHDLTPAQKQAIFDLGEPALGFEPREERVYPHGRLAAHILGRISRDGAGSMGLERAYDKELRDPAALDQPLVLSIDHRVQYALTDELEIAMRAHQAKGAAGAVMDVNTGEIIAMVSLPDFDPNSYRGNEQSVMFNRVSMGTYELGSIFKTFTFAAALDEGVVGMADGYDATKPLRVSRFRIEDDHPKERYLTLPEIFAYSSNIGTAQMALDLGADRQQAFLDKIGILSQPGLEIGEVAMPQVPSRWGKAATMTISYGYGLSVTPVQALTSISSMVNGGMLRAPTLIKQNSASVYSSLGERVIKASTSRQIRQLMRLAVVKGTGRAADARGYMVGGKTGTAEKSVAGGYNQRALITSFMGVFPMDDPRYAVIALLDEPKGTEATFGLRSAGWTAAPVVKNVVLRTAPLLGVDPRAADPGLYQSAAALMLEED